MSPWHQSSARDWPHRQYWKHKTAGASPSPWYRLTTVQSMGATSSRSCEYVVLPPGTPDYTDRMTMPILSVLTVPSRLNALGTSGVGAFRSTTSEIHLPCISTTTIRNEYTWEYRCRYLLQCCKGSEVYTLYYVRITHSCIGDRQSVQAERLRQKALRRGYALTALVFFRLQLTLPIW
jgi:hypothetical protein